MARAKILVVDDDPSASERLAVRLRALGYEAAGLTPGEAPRAGRTPHDVVLLRMPDAPADDAASAAPVGERYAGPVILLLDAVDDAALRRAARAEAAACLVAPFGDGQLRAAIEIARARPDPSLILDSVGEALLATDRDAQVTRLNGTAERLTGWPAAEAVGRPVVAVLNLVDGATRAAVPNPLREALRTGEPMACPDAALLLARDGRGVRVEGGASPIRAAEGDVIGAVLVLRDVTARPAGQAGAIGPQHPIASLAPGTALRESLAAVADTISQPLMAIAANAASCLRWLKGPSVDIEEASRAAERIGSDIRRAGDVVSRIRAIARYAGPVLCEFDLDDAVGEVLLLVQATLHRKAIAVRTFSAAPHRVLADRAQIQQVVLNVVTNSVEALDATSRPRRISVEITGQDAREVTVTIADSGAGLDPATRERIFDAFFTTKADGFGMGLTVSRNIIEAHGGRIWAAPGPLAGATVSFTIPTLAGRQHLARLA